MSDWTTDNEGRTDPACTAATRAALMLFARAAAIALVAWIALTTLVP